MITPHESSWCLSLSIPQHFRQSHPDKTRSPLFCADCPAAFVQFNALLEHSRQKHPESPLARLKVSALSESSGEQDATEPRLADDGPSARNDKDPERPISPIGTVRHLFKMRQYSLLVLNSLL